ncbi:ABC transporter permease [Enterovirga sp.]|uniref:ABC transporter permease n=1 Tax=Enterovirga sp. TaxID=2026350 RepID=UPI0026269374|nr:ABC transporter permease [Enterovirga sp.]MDB5590355.1 transporter [Enterovirga sp.]
MAIEAAARRRLDSPLAIQLRVIWALMLRDIRTRFFGHGLGYLIAIAWPLAHITLLLLIYHFTGRVAPLGDSLVLFFSTALVPVMSFMYMSRFIMFAATTNRPLVGFPIVKIIDLFLARAALEMLASCCMAIIVLTVLYVSGLQAAPVYPLEALFAFGAALLLGVGMGILNGMIAMALPAWPMFYQLMSIVIYVSSGVLFMPSALPEPMVYALSWNPIFHAVEWMRTAYFMGYTSNFIDKPYLLGWGVGALFLGLGVERLVRGALLR